MKKVPRNYHEAGLQLNGLIHNLVEGSVKVFSASSQIVLLVAQVQVRNVNEAERLHGSCLL
jgi:hypothetical protein